MVLHSVADRSSPSVHGGDVQPAGLAQEGSLTPDEDVAEMERLLYGAAERLETDAQGRVVLPRWHTDEVKIGTEVTVVGARDRLEVHAGAAWKAALEQRKTQMAAVLARMSARKPSSAD
ncbi:MAG: division/cell wall cluster transcriptional repressor MraZ [Phycisphaerales bacterium]